MATLTRARVSSTDLVNGSHYDHALTLDIPKPFPTRAEREQAEILESLALEDLQLNDTPASTAGPSTIHHPITDTRKLEGELLPSIIDLQTSCLTTLNDLLSSSSKGVDDATFLQKLRLRMDLVAPTLSPRDADLAHALLALLTYFHMLSSLYSSSSIQPSLSSSYFSSPPDAMPSPYKSPISHLRQHLSDFKLERLSRSDSELLSASSSPILSVQTALLWTQIDEQLDTVLSLCRISFDDTSTIHLPPQYDSADYEHDCESEGLPEYEQGDYEPLGRSSKSLDKGSDADISPTMSFPSTNEKMRMDLEAVTQAIDRLYEVAPQLLNQRVELKKTKVEQMERARQEGKQKALDESTDERELEMMLEMIGKAAERKMPDQAVVMNADLKTRMARANDRERAKRTAFVEQLVRHSGAGRLASQDATFPISPTSRSATAVKMQDPEALLTLPEFIREAMPEAVSERMRMNERVSLPDFVKEPLPDQVIRSTRHSRVQSVSMTNVLSSQDPSTTDGISRPSSKSGKPRILRSRSLSAPPLAWLLSNSSSRSASPAKSPKTARPGSSQGRTPSLEVSLGVTYVAEYHENLQHVLVFLTIHSVIPNVPVEAEVRMRQRLDQLPYLFIRCGTSSSDLLELPARVTPGTKEIKLVGESHYEIKLPTISAQWQLHCGSPSPPPVDIEPASIMDAMYFTSTDWTSFICTSCSLPLVHSSQVNTYRDLPSEHWAELVDAWMCHADMKLHEHVKKNSKYGFWPKEGEVLVGGSYVLLQEHCVVKSNLCESGQDDSLSDDWTRVRCICGAVVGRCQEHATERGTSVLVYRLTKYAFRPVNPATDPVKMPLSAFVVEDMNEFVQAHATYRFVIVDEEEDRPRILIWLFKPNMRLSYTTTTQYAIPKSGAIRAAKILFRLLGPSTSPSDLSNVLHKYPGFPQAEHIYYPIDICRRIAVVLKESNKAYPESLRTMTGLDVGWLQRA